jgi:hypothetical protein
MAYCEHSDNSLGCIKSRSFEQLNKYQLLKKILYHWVGNILNIYNKHRAWDDAEMAYKTST